MNRWSQKLEIAANVAILVVAIALVGVLVKAYLLKPAKLKPESVTVGSNFVLDQFDWNKSEHTLLIALQPGCSYCAESAPFYRQLSTNLSRSGKTRLVALLPEQSSNPSAYLKDLGIVVDEMRQVSMPKAKITGTPTVVLVNRAGTVEQVWAGKLSASQEKDVSERLRN